MLIHHSNLNIVCKSVKYTNFICKMGYSQYGNVFAMPRTLNTEFGVLVHLLIPSKQTINQ